MAGPDVLFSAEDSQSLWESPLFPLVPELAPALPDDCCVYCCGLAGRLLQEYEVTDSTEDTVTADAGTADCRLTAQFYATEDAEAASLSLPAGAPVTDAFGRVLALVEQFSEGDALACVPLFGLQGTL